MLMLPLRVTVNVDGSVRAVYVSPESLREVSEGPAHAGPLQRAPELLGAHFPVLGCMREGGGANEAITASWGIFMPDTQPSLYLSNEGLHLDL